MPRSQHLKDEIRRSRRREYKENERKTKRSRKDISEYILPHATIKKKKKSRKIRLARRLQAVKDRPESMLQRYRQLNEMLRDKFENCFVEFFKTDRDFDEFRIRAQENVATNLDVIILEFVDILEEYIQISLTYCIFHAYYNNPLPDRGKPTFINVPMVVNGRKRDIAFAKPMIGGYTSIPIHYFRSERWGIYKVSFYEHFYDGAFIIGYEEILKMPINENHVRQVPYVIRKATLYHSCPHEISCCVSRKNLEIAGFELSTFSTVRTVQSSERLSGSQCLRNFLTSDYDSEAATSSGRYFVDIEKKILKDISEHIYTRSLDI